ncbi:MAG: methanogenesis marker 17 protein [Candidatus Methanogaster sp.]|uniref:Methanogenesis marker 17 protein n=1 Tax=Candidatus Methanogaster sp. TaxID=3386292 RepID=A0AC61L5N5_9EURY|nr:MAG: methanogenesis marker 17 protein [ANME-2 cluster archaeon]
MLPLEVFRVESPDKTGAEAYESVIRDVLADLELTTVLGRLWVHIDPAEPVFLFCTLIRTGLPPICVKDMADISTGTPSTKQVELKLTNEEHVSTLLSILWIEYGRENVSQPERLVITIDTEEKDRVAKELVDVVIADPRREIETRLADALLRITPEGFRVRHHVSTGSEMLFVASEDSIKPEWVMKAENMMDQLKEDL